MTTRDESAVPKYTRAQSIFASRVVICAAVGLSLGSYFLQPETMFAWVAVILFRTWLHFISGSMAHEGTHGNLGRSRLANLWWGRLALIPTTVPYTSFRLTHLAHHAHTNIPGKDPDAFLDTPHLWQFPFRALAMPHHWVVWLRRQGKFGRAAILEYVLTYAAYTAIYGAIAYFVGVAEVLAGLLIPAVLHSFLLWYAFAYKTHEGYSTGSSEARSHEYYGRLAFWFSFGLSVHRLHHVKPGLGWLQMLPHVPRGTALQELTFRRDVRV